MSEQCLPQLPGPWWAGGKMTSWKWVVKTTTVKRLMQLIFHYAQCLRILISLDSSSFEAQIKFKWLWNEREHSLWYRLSSAVKWLKVICGVRNILWIRPWQANVHFLWKIHTVATAGSSLKGRFQGHSQWVGTSPEVNLARLKKE